MAPSYPATYVLPLRRWNGATEPELWDYLRELTHVPAAPEVIVVDGSSPELFAAHAAFVPAGVRHVALPAEAVTPNGKVGAVRYGVGLASAKRIVVADDDVRYDAAAWEAILAKLDGAAVVLPQNYFAPAPWHALWDGARSLIARSTGGDWPGTLGFRRADFARAEGYAGDVLFENFELVRSLRRAGCRVDAAGALFVRRLPPDAKRFWEQRVRQAYDEFARPLRLAFALALLPFAFWCALARKPRLLLVPFAAALALAEAGRRRDGARAYFPFAATLFAPLWLAERALTSWLAVWARARGGVRYAGGVLKKAAT